MGLKLPTRTEVQFIEHRGENREVEVEDRPYRVLENEFNENKGIYEDIERPLTDYDILEAGGLQTFFNDDGTRKNEAWPYDPDKVVKSAKNRPAKKKAKKKTGKK